MRFRRLPFEFAFVESLFAKAKTEISVLRVVPNSILYVLNLLASRYL